MEQGHEYHLYSYQNVDVPSGVRLRDANEIIPFDKLFYYYNPLNNTPDISPFSDLFRFKLLSIRGGWWSDVDAICLQASIPEVDQAWAQELPEDRPNAIGTSQMAFRKRHPLVVELYKRCNAMCETDFPIRESTGPVLISDTIEELGYQKNMFGNADSFYPVRWIETFKMWLPQFRSELEIRSKNAYFMPIYASYPKYLGLDLDKLPPEDSYLSELFGKYYRGHAVYQRQEVSDVVSGLMDFIRKNSTWAMPEIRKVSGIDALRTLGIGSKLTHIT